MYMYVLYKYMYWSLDLLVCFQFKVCLFLPYIPNKNSLTRLVLKRRIKKATVIKNVIINTHNNDTVHYS